MANTLTDLRLVAKSVQESLRRRGGAFRFSNVDFQTEVAKNLGDTVDAIFAQSLGVQDVTGSHTRLVPLGATPTKVQIVLNKWKQSDPLGLTHKESMEIAAVQPRWFQEQVVEMVDAVVGQAEIDLLKEASASAGLVFAGDGSGSAATASLAKNSDIFAALNQNFFNTKAPEVNRHLFLPSSFAKSLRQNLEWQKVNQVGNADMLREGTLGRFQSFDMRESHYLPQHNSASVNIDAAIAIQRNGLGVAVRPGNSGEGTTTFTDPVSGIPLVLTAERQTYQTVWSVSLLYGVKVIRGGFINLIPNR